MLHVQFCWRENRNVIDKFTCRLSELSGSSVTRKCHTRSAGRRIGTCGAGLWWCIAVNIVVQELQSKGNNSMNSSMKADDNTLSHHAMFILCNVIRFVYC